MQTKVRYPMERRKFIIGVGSLAAGGAAAMGSGAFCAMSADRSASIYVVNDAAGLIALIPNNDIGQVYETGGGELAIDTSEGHDGATYGVNVGSQYQFGRSTDATFSVDGGGAGTDVPLRTEWQEEELESEPVALWQATHFDDEDAEFTTFMDFEGYTWEDPDEAVDPVVTEPAFTVQNNDTEAKDVVITLDSDIAGVLDSDEDDYTLTVEDVGSGETIDVMFAVFGHDGEGTVGSGTVRVDAD